MKKLVLVLSILHIVSLFLSAQVVNTERLRFNDSEKKWEGNFDFSFGLNRTKAGETLILNTQGKIQYNRPKETWMLLSGYWPNPISEYR